jgi:hypothetical protein
MKTDNKILLLIDSVVNIAIGLILLCYPLGMGDYLQLQKADNDFYPIILGAVFFVIG